MRNRPADLKRRTDRILDRHSSDPATLCAAIPAMDGATCPRLVLRGDEVRRGKHNSASRTANLSTRSNHESSGKEQQADVDQEVTETVTTLRALDATGKPVQVVPGPILRETIAVEGKETRALIDTGSPVTVISLKFLLQAFTDQKPPGQTREDWEKQVKQRFTVPNMILKTYDGTEMDIAAETVVKVSAGVRNQL